ncbi:glutaminase domain-containing protein [Streptomyces sp. NPDC088725]|uniref:glutaminase domain-containing protein n=1 Tax=Streptomyces sp. NPDC088725 TaxID=3365873 RepID=UPI0038275961
MFPEEHDPESHSVPSVPAPRSPLPPPSLSRRGLLRRAGGIAAGTAAAMWLPQATALAASRSSAPAAGPVASAPLIDGTFTPLRPPATPLIVRSPYLTTWQASDTLTGTWASFWNGHTTALCGIARIDGTPYVFAGDPRLSGTGAPALATMTQTSLEVTATRSIYTLTGGGVTLTVTFLSPVDPGDLRRQSVPFGYVTVTAASADGGRHSVDLHFDTSGEWAHGDVTTQIGWSQQRTGSMTVLSCAPARPAELAENNELATWGTLVVAAPTSTGLTWQIGEDTVVRTASSSQGALNNTSDTAQPRAINDRWPVLGLNKDLGTVAPGATSAPFTVTIGHVRTPAVSYLGTPLNPWWTKNWGSWPEMADWVGADYDAALTAATALDKRVHDDAVQAAGGGTTGEHYAGICALALRQAFGGTELVDRDGSPWAFLKEISSNGNMSTVDVIYPAFPAYLQLSPDYLRLLLEPLLHYAEHGGWPKEFAEHDLGTHYPNAAGHNDGNEEDMEVEESANMLIMVAALVQRLPAADAASYATAHYPILRQWAEYLVGNALDPGFQNQTDDFTGFIAHSANLALKGIIGIGAMGVISQAAGNTADADHYRSTSRSYASQWVVLAEDSSGSHLKLAYDQDGTWSLKYNGFADRLLGLDLVPTGVAALEGAWYAANTGSHGVLLDPRNNYTKGDWEIWTAAWLADQPAVRNGLVEGVYSFANTTPQRVPFTDWYVVANANQQGFAARPVIGGVFALAVKPAASTTQWRRIRNQKSGKVLAVSGMSLADSAEVTQWADNGTDDHLWTLVGAGAGDDTVRIVNRNSGKCLAVHDQSGDDGAHAQQYRDNGTPDHLWRIVDAGGGWSKIVNVHSGKVLAVDQQSLADGAQVTQWTDNGSPDHLWQLV